MDRENGQESGQKWIPSAVCMLLANAVNLLIYFTSDSLIIPIGIKGYRAIQGVGIFAASITTLWFAVAMIRLLLEKKKEAPKEEPESVYYANEGMLSASGKLSDEYVLECVTRQGTGKWRIIKEDVEAITDQLILMNSYQERLSNLLANNSAGALSDAEGLLDKVEQQILGNVRKVLNYMEILGTEDKEAVLGYLKACAKDNERLLSSTKTFLISVTGYLNDQGEDSSKSLKMLEEFQNVLAGEETFAQKTAEDQVVLKL